MIMAKEDMTYFKMVLDTLSEGQKSIGAKMDTAIAQLARQDEHLKNLNSKIATQEVYNATTNARFTDVYNEFSKASACRETLEKRIMTEGFEKEKGFMRLEFKIAIISGVIYLLITFGPEVAGKLFTFFI